MKRGIRLQYNSPVVLSFALISLAALILGVITKGATTVKYFSVYRSSLADIFTYPRFFFHVLGHSSYVKKQVPLFRSKSSGSATV